MWDPASHVKPRTSFIAPVAAPTVGPCDPPLACISVNVEYLKFIAGSMSQLVQRTTWLAADEDELQGILANMTWAIEVIGTAVQCNTLPVIPGQPTIQTACNVAGYIANYIIRHSITQAIQAKQNDQQILGFLDLLGPLFIPIFPITSFGIGAIIFLFNRIIPAQIAAFQSAIDDPFLFGNISCAIYNAIASDGQVTPANFPTIVSNVDALVFASSYVHDTVVQMITDMGADGLAALQAPGVVASYDCSGCGTGSIIGPVGPQPKRFAGRVVLEIIAGAADVLLPVLFPTPFPSPPQLTIGGDNEQLLASFQDVTTTGFTAVLSAAVPVGTGTTGGIDYVALLPGGI